MRIFRTINEVRQARLNPVAFVPTMGALHEGHLSLVRLGRTRCDETLVSIFVNPTQFGPKEDFSKYPRDEARDLALIESAGATAAFLPSVDEMYRNSSTNINVSGVTSRWEGEIRPGHFTGVATVVNKLFNIVQPTVALFGEKDFQQCAVIRAMVADLDMPVELMFGPTVREPDGLAMSSRNVYLSSEDRQLAPELYRAICDLSSKLVEGVSRHQFNPIIEHHHSILVRLGFDVDYLELVDSVSLEPAETVDKRSRIIVAAKIGTTRLIDNCAAILD